MYLALNPGPYPGGGCKGAGAPPFLLKEGCNDEFAPPPPRRNCFHKFLTSSYKLYSPSKN